MKVNPKIEFKYIDYSNNIFTKIQLVNALTQKEFNILNENYKKLGLFIQQVKVDNFGNEISPNELLSENNFLHKKRRLKKKSRMTLEEFYEKYYINDKKKYLNSSNKSSNKSNNKNKNNEEKLCQKEYLSSLHDKLKSIYKDCQNIDFKKCKIDDENYKKEIMEYIKKYSKYITRKQYYDLFNKWRNKNFEIKGNNFSDFGDLSSWRIPVLKSFKSEIYLFATLNTIGKKIGKENNSEEKEEEDKNKNEDNNNDDKDESEEDKSESSYSSDNYFKGNYNIPMNKDNENDNDEQ